jgi:glycosyltransferase involved in cell wall biosynthesis
MKILMISHFVPFPPQGGARQRNYNLLREISGNNDVWLVTLNQKALLPTVDKLEHSLNMIREHCKYLRVFPIPTDRSKILWFLLLLLNLFSLKPYSVWRFKSRAMRREVRRLVSQEKFDIIHVDTVDLIQYVTFTRGLSIALNHHNVESALLYRRAQGERSIILKLYLYLQAWKLQRYETHAMKFVDINLTVSANDAAVLRRHCPGAEYREISNGVDTGYFAPAPGQIEDNNIIFVASLDWYPNLDAVAYFVRDLWPVLRDKHPGLVFNLLGGPPPNYIIEYGKSDPSFVIHGFVEDIRPHVARAAVYVVPIRIGGGTRLKILDAMAMGKAVVSTSIGCEGLRVTDGRDIIVADGAEKFADSVIRIVKNPELRERLSRHARETAVNVYSWSKIGPALEDAYKDICMRRKQSRI